MELNFKRNLLHNSLKDYVYLYVYLCIDAHTYILRKRWGREERRKREERLSQQILRM